MVTRLLYSITASVIMATKEVESDPKLLVYFHKCDKENQNLSVPGDVVGLLRTEVLQSDTGRGKILACGFNPTTDSETQFSQNLKSALERDGLSGFCSVSSQLSHQNGVCVLNVEGMTCNSCVKLIESTVSQVSGVRTIKVSLQFKEAFIEFNPTVIKPAELSSEIYDMGFDAEVTAKYVLTSVPQEQSGLSLSPCQSTKSVSPATSSSFATIMVDIEGMTCSSCVQNIESNISKEKGVLSIAVSLKAKNAQIAFNISETTPEKLVDAIYELGFDAKLRKSPPNMESCGKGDLKVYDVGIDGMTCSSCVSLIESVLGDLEGVISVHVSLVCKEGTVELNDALISIDFVTKTIDEMGFIVTYAIRECMYVCIGIPPPPPPPPNASMLPLQYN